MKWFGKPWPSPDFRAPICEDDALQIPTPVGSECILCGEAILLGHQGVQYINGPYGHVECQYRSVVGNIHHLMGQCHHVGECNEMSTKTYREEAIEVWNYEMS